MLIIGFCAAVAFFVVVATLAPEGAGFALFCGVGGALIAGLLAFVFVLIIGLFMPRVYEEYEFNIRAANDNTLTSGSFGIFGGYIEEEPVYFFYREGPDGAIRQGHIPVENTVIYEDQETRAFIKVTKTVDEMGLYYFRPGGDKEYEIHVPPGSVSSEIDFDLE